MIRNLMLAIALSALVVIVGATMAAQGHREHLESQLRWQCGVEVKWVPNFWFDLFEKGYVPKFLQGASLVTLAKQRHH